MVDSAIRLARSKRTEQDRKVCENTHSGITIIWNMIKRGWPILSKDSEALPTQCRQWRDIFNRQREVFRIYGSRHRMRFGAYEKVFDYSTSLVDSSSSRRPFRAAEELVGTAVVKSSQIMLAATTTTQLA